MIIMKKKILERSFLQLLKISWEVFEINRKSNALCLQLKTDSMSFKVKNCSLRRISIIAKFSWLGCEPSNEANDND